VTGVWVALSAAAKDSSAMTVCSCSRDGSLAFLDSASVSVTRRIALSKLALGCVRGLAGTDDLVVGSWDNALYRYSIATGRVTHKVEAAHDDSVCCLSQAPDADGGSGSRPPGGALATGGWDSAAKLWVPHADGSLVPVCAFYGQRCAVEDVALSQHEWLVATAGRDDGRVLLHDARAGRDAVWEATAPPSSSAASPACTLAWASAARRLLSCSPAHGVRLHDLRGGEKGVVSESAGSHAWRPRRLATDGHRVLVGDELGRVTSATLEDLWQVGFDSSTVARHARASPITALAVGARGGDARGVVVATGTSDGEVGVFRVRW